MIHWSNLEITTGLKKNKKGQGKHRRSENNLCEPLKPEREKKNKRYELSLIYSGNQTFWLASDPPILPNSY